MDWVTKGIKYILQLQVVIEAIVKWTALPRVIQFTYHTFYDTGLWLYFSNCFDNFMQYVILPLFFAVQYCIKDFPFRI